MVVEPGGHAQDDELERYSMRDIADDECARLEEHLLICEACRERLEEHDLIASAIAAEGERWRAEQAPPEKTWRFPWLIFAFASLALFVAGALWLSRHSRPALPPVAVALSATRGVAGEAQAAAGRPLDLKPDLTGLAPLPRYDLQVVDSTGAEIAHGETAPEGVTRISPLKPGTYFVRIYSPSGELLREYALEIKLKA
jgi:hypothetical protein